MMREKAAKNTNTKKQQNNDAVCGMVIAVSDWVALISRLCLLLSSLFLLFGASASFLFLLRCISSVTFVLWCVVFLSVLGAVGFSFMAVGSLVWLRL